MLQRQPQPQPQAPPQAAAPRQPADWLRDIRAATSTATLESTLASVLTEFRQHVEAGEGGLGDDAIALGDAAGLRLWELARGAADFGNVSHFQPLQRIEAAIRGTAASSATVSGRRAARLQTFMRRMGDAFVFAARGASSVSFRRTPAPGGAVVRILVTGFDPFLWSGAIPPSLMNPSGAVALALDNTTIPLTGGATAIVESVVLPVSFSDFSTGLVERIGRGAIRGGADAILTVSLDESIGVGGPVRLERYVVGVHQGASVPLGATPPEPGGRNDRVIIETPAPLQQVQSDVGAAGGGVQAPTIGTNVTFRLDTDAEAQRFVTASGGTIADPANAPTDVTVSDPARIGEITSSMREQRDRSSIRFRVGGGSFRATVVSGPGGFFLSNEVSYRMLRLLRSRRATRSITSFHTHVGPLAPGSRVPASATGQTAAGAQRTQLISTMQAIIRSVAQGIVARRRP
jgi:hypothetical protein